MQTKIFTTSDGVQTVFSVPFPYIDRSHVVVLVDENPVSFSWLSGTQVELTLAAPAGAKVSRERVTPASPLIDFVQGAALSDNDLDIVATQGLFLAQEAKDALETTLVLDAQGAFTVEDRRLTGLLDPTQPQDAANKRWVETFSGNYVAAAQAARDAAQGSATSANGSAAAAAVSAAQAAAYAALIDFDRTTNNTWTGSNSFSQAVTLPGIAGGVIPSQAAAEAGTDNTKAMTPLRTVQAIAANTKGSRVLLTTAAIAGASVVDLTQFDAALYDAYEFHLRGVVPASGGAILGALMFSQVLGNWRSGAIDYYATTQSNHVNGEMAASTNAIKLSGSIPLDNVVGRGGVYGSFVILDPHEPARRTTVVGSTLAPVNGAIAATVSGASQVGIGENNTGIRFLMSAGTFQAGLITLYGIRKG